MSCENAPTYRMLGRNVRVEYDSSGGAAILRDELSRYPVAEASSVPDLTVRYRPVDTSECVWINPAVHGELEDGFVMKERTAHVRFDLDGARLRRIDFHPASAKSVLIAGMRRWLDMQYSSREERSGVIFHELVAAPAAYWMKHVVLVHASAFSDEQGVVLVGGAGGVGKTSLALALCQSHGFRFVADDIAFVDRDGSVYPNLAYPKLYAYNVEGDPEMSRRVLADRGLGDHIHWRLHRCRGSAHVRRRIAPDDLYGEYDDKGGPLRQYILLVREARADIRISDLEPRRASAMSMALMDVEYGRFHDHLRWHEFHRIIEGRAPSLTQRATLMRWEEAFCTVLDEVPCLLARVPIAIEHGAFRDRMAKLLTS